MVILVGKLQQSNTQVCYWGTDCKEKRMMMRPACELDGEIYRRKYFLVWRLGWMSTGHPSLASVAAVFMSLLAMSLSIHDYEDGSWRHP